MCNKKFQDVYESLFSRIPSSARILSEIGFLFHYQKMWGEEEEQQWCLANEVK